MALRDYTIRVATPDDAVRRYGYPIPWPWTGLAMEENGELIGLGGVVWKDDGRCWCFLNCQRMPPAITAHRTALRLLQHAFAAGEDMIFVVPTPGIVTAKPWLTALGFRFHEQADDLEVWAACPVSRS